MNHHETRVNARLKPLLWGLAVSTVAGAALLLTLSAVLTAQDIPMTAVAPMAVAAAGLGVLSGGFTAAKIGKKRGLLTGALLGMVFTLLITLIGIAWPGEFDTAAALIKLLVFTLTGAAGGFLGVCRKRKK